jgi:hypothetical protein
MMKDVKPFPIPEAFNCPYCGAKALQSDFNPRTGAAIFTHHNREKKKVGQVSTVTVHTVHVFATIWRGSEWEHSPGIDLNTYKVCERVEIIPRGQSTDWASCDRED